MAYLTLADAKTAFLVNAGYANAGSASQARAFVEACAALLLLLPKRAKHGRAGSEVEMDPAMIRAQQVDAQRWIARGGGSVGGAVRYADFSNFRD